MSSLLHDQAPTPHAIVQELDAICGSSSFARATEAVRLLRFLVERQQAGLESQLRETSIGCELYGRNPSYDPKLDAVVRVNATRLRTRLDEYYALNPGARLRITLHKGSYVPLYEIAGHPADAAASGAEPASVRRLNEVVTLASSPATGLHIGRLVSPGNAWLLACLGLLGLTLAWFTWKVHAHEQTAGIWIARPFARQGGMNEFPAFSPDGRSIAFASTLSPAGLPALYIQDIASDTPRVLTGQARAETRPAWSPDGGRIAFIHPVGDGVKQVVVRTMPSGKETVITTLQGSLPWLCGNPRLSWSARGDKLFTSAAGVASASPPDVGLGGRCSVVAIDVASHTVRAITQSPTGTVGDLEAAAMPDGRSVAFLREASFGVLDVYLVDSAGGPVHRATFENRDIIGFAPDPGDGTLILASRGRDAIVRLRKRDLKTGASTLLTDGSAPVASPAISPATQSIAFASYRSTANIYRAFASGDLSLVVDGGHQAGPEISPDGGRLAYASDRTGFLEIWISDADGHHGMRLTKSEGTAADNPSWSPDGRSILFECRDQQSSQICTMPVDGKGHIVRLTQGSSDHLQPSFSRDGRFIYYSSNHSGRFEAYRQAAQGGEPVQITTEGGTRAVESWDGRSIYAERERDGGILLQSVPISETTSSREKPRPFVLTERKLPAESAWNAGPGGIVFCRRVTDWNEFIQVDDQTGKEHLLAKSRNSAGARELSVASDGSSVVYAATPKYSAEITLLTPAK